MFRKFKILLFIISFSALGQTNAEKLIHGKILIESGNIDGIYIENATNKKTTITDSKGDFFILAKANDLLVFSSLTINYQSKLIEEKDLVSDVVIVNLKPKIIALQEVVVKKYSEINAVSLGISRKGIKKYTPAERRLYTAQSTTGDAFLNALSGRTAMLKKEIIVEKKERCLVYLESLFENDFYISSLKISSDYIKGFRCYCVEDAIFISVLETKNKIKIEFALVEMAKKYNEILAE